MVMERSAHRARDSPDPRPAVEGAAVVIGERHPPQPVAARRAGVRRAVAGSSLVSTTQLLLPRAIRAAPVSVARPR
jgi:hypothetical protein